MRTDSRAGETVEQRAARWLTTIAQLDLSSPPRATRATAIEGLLAVAQLEEFVAAGIDEPGYHGELARHLGDHAAHLRRVALAAQGRPQAGVRAAPLRRV
jgi:hypothetical protein